MGTGLINGYGDFTSIVRLESDDIYTKLFNKILWSPFLSVGTLVLEYFPLFSTVEFPHPCLGYHFMVHPYLVAKIP